MGSLPFKGAHLTAVHSLEWPLKGALYYVFHGLARTLCHLARIPSES